MTQYREFERLVDSMASLSSVEEDMSEWVKNVKLTDVNKKDHRELAKKLNTLTKCERLSITASDLKVRIFHENSRKILGN
jgi:histidinol dehydrogenase